MNLTELYSHYREIYDRINRHMEKFAYATYSENDLDSWTFDNKDTIIVNTSGYCFGNNDYDDASTSIECKYLENDAVFEKWIDERYNARKNKDAEKAKHEAKVKEDYERNLYETLKKKFE